MMPEQKSETMTLQIDIAIHCGGWPQEKVLHSLAHKAFEAAISTAGLSHDETAETSLVFTSDSDIRTLNKEWRKKDSATNVLSFPAAELLGRGRLSGPMLGDIVLALETCKREAALEECTLEDHLSHLLVHGFLHLFGYDHEIDRDGEEMEALETKILAQLGIANPYT